MCLSRYAAVMLNSKFKKVYLNILSEEYET